MHQKTFQMKSLMQIVDLINTWTDLGRSKHFALVVH